MTPSPHDPPVSLTEALTDALNAWPASDDERREFGRAITEAARITDSRRFAGMDLRIEA